MRTACQYLNFRPTDYIDPDELISIDNNRDESRKILNRNKISIQRQTLRPSCELRRTWTVNGQALTNLFNQCKMLRELSGSPRRIEETVATACKYVHRIVRSL